MENNYVIIWVAKERIGEGVSAKQFCEADAKKLAAELNEEHPEFLHRAVDVTSEKIKEALLQLKREVLYAQSEAAEKTLQVSFTETASGNEEAMVTVVALESEEELDAVPA